MGNWNRHFVRVGSDGNMGVFDQYGNRFIRENVGSDLLPGIIAFLITSETNYSLVTPSERNAIAFNSIFNNTPRITSQGSVVFNTLEYINYDTSTPLNLNNNGGKIDSYNGMPASLNGFALIGGSPDLRIGVTAADASPITILSSTSGSRRYEVKARILATAGTSATYTISWTEGGSVRTVALTVTAVGTEVHDNFVIAPDAGTDITAQITALTSSTVNVDAIVSVLG